VAIKLSADFDVKILKEPRIFFESSNISLVPNEKPYNFFSKIQKPHNFENLKKKPSFKNSKKKKTKFFFSKEKTAF
jgi:hypothetical protein